MLDNLFSGDKDNEENRCLEGSYDIRIYDEAYKILCKDTYFLLRDNDCLNDEIKIIFPKQISSKYYIFKLPWENADLNFIAQYLEEHIDLLLNGNEWLEKIFNNFDNIEEKYPHWVEQFVVHRAMKKDKNKEKEIKEEVNKTYKKKIIFNKLIIEIYWDDKKDAYIISLSKRGEENNFNDSIIISPNNSNPDITFKLFNFACELGKEGKNKDYIYEKLQEVISHKLFNSACELAEKCDNESNYEKRKTIISEMEEILNKINYIILRKEDDFKPHAPFEYYSYYYKNGRHYSFAEINGVDFQIGWNDWDRVYDIYFPNLKTSFVDPEMATEQTIQFPEGWEVAKKFFSYAIELARKGLNDNQIYKELEKIEMLPDGTFPEKNFSVFGEVGRFSQKQSKLTQQEQYNQKGGKDCLGGKRIKSSDFQNLSEN